VEVDVKFHCDVDYNFPADWEQIRAFTYYDYSIALHTHSFYEINIVTSGHGTHQISEAAFDVQAGDVFIIPPMIPHAYYNTEALDVMHILVKPEVIQCNLAEAASMNGFLLFTEIEPFLRASSYSSSYLRLSQKNWQMIRGDLEFLLDSNECNTAENWPLRLHTFWKLLYSFSMLLAKQLEEKRNAEKYECQIIDTLEYIHRNFYRTLTVKELYERVFLSRSTFLRSFSQICGCTPTKYISDYRLKKALELMDDGGMTKTAIARACGYYDLSHLEQVIKRKGRSDL